MLFRVGAPNWVLKSVTLRGVDITDTPTELSGFEDLDGVRLVLTDRLTEVTGTVVDDRGRPADSASVVVLPADEREGLAAQRYVRVMRLPPGGQLSLRGLPAGRYVDRRVLIPGEWRRVGPARPRTGQRGWRRLHAGRRSEADAQP